MYTVLIGDIYGNDTPLYYPNDNEYVIYEATLNETVGLCGEFTFKVPVSNPLYAQLAEFKVITINEDNKERWRGFIKEISEEEGLYAEVYCLEDLAWLQTEYVAPVQQRVDRAAMLASVISSYNTLGGVAGTVKTFETGYIASGGAGLFEVNYGTSLLEALRGLAGDDQYVRVRRTYSNGVIHRYIDFATLNSFGKTSSQNIEFGTNLVDFIKELNTSWMLNVIYPYGMEIDGEEVFEGCTRRIAGTAISDAQKVNKYGRIAKNIMFDTSDPTTLQALAAQYLNMNKDPRLTLELTAVDLAQAGYNVDSLACGDKVRVIADPLKIDQYVYITELNIDLQNPDKNTITLSSTMTSRNTLTEQTNQIAAEVINKIPSRSSILAAAKENAIAMLNGSEGGVVNFIFDSNDRMTEIWITDSVDPLLATKKWVWNSNGLGYMYVEDGRWKLSAAITMDGAIVANRITTGVLGDQAGRNFWNMETGEFALSAGATVGGSTVQSIANSAAQSARTAAEATAAAALAAQVAIYDADIADLQSQIDGNVTTWYYSGAPTLNNLPASQWTTTTDKDNHIGDLYYDSVTGYAYRFMKSGSAYTWIKISDSDISAALSEAQDAWDLADNKRRVFITQPVPPYDIGDLWAQGSSGDIKRCATAKTASQTFAASDWVLASKYTDDSALTSWVSGTYASDKSFIQTQIDSKAETWYQSADPSSAWTTTALKDAHVGDLWYKTTDHTTWYYTKDGSIYKWVQQDVPTEVFDEIDGKAQIFTSQPTTPYHVGDLWFASTSAEIKVCITERLSGDYNAGDWAKRDKYTDDSAFTSFRDGTYANFVITTNDALGGKITTYYQASTPTAKSTGDLWIDTDDSNKLYRWNGLQWILVRDTGIQSALTAASNAQTTADGKIVTFAQSTQPTATDIGDLWIDTDDNNKMYRWNGTLWVAYSDSSALVAWVTSTYMPNQSYLQEQIDGKAETYYQPTDPSTEWETEPATALTITFDSQCDTEATYDYIDIFYKENPEDTSYSYIRKTGGFGGLSINIPATELYIYWHTDISTTRWGWKVDSISSYYGTDYTTPSATGTSLPAYTPTDKGISELESEHPYTNDINEVYHVAVQITHRGDLWHDTTDNKTYIWDGSKWIEQPVPDEVFDKIDGKAQIFTSTPTVPYNVGDLWFNSTSSDIMTCVTARATGNYSASDWQKRNKYTDDSAVTALDNSLNQQDVFNRLTNNGQTQGIYLQNGRLYINADYIRSGTISADRVRTGEIKSENYSFASGYFSDAGTMIDLDSGDIVTEGLVSYGDRQSGEGILGSKTLIKNSLLILNTSGGTASIGLQEGITLELVSRYASLTSRQLFLGWSNGEGNSITIDAESANGIFREFNSVFYTPTWSTSDKRIKEEIEPLNPEISKRLIDLTEPKKFRYMYTGGKHYGMLAQDVREQLDSLGETDAMLEHSMGIPQDKTCIEDQRTIDYQEYIPHLINYVKDLREEIESLKGQIKELRK